MKKPAAWRWAALCAALLLASCSSPESQPVYFVAAPTEAKVLNFENRFFADIYRHAGITAVLETFPGTSFLQEANDGRADAVAASTTDYAAPYGNLVQIPAPLMALEYRALTIGPPIEVHGWDSLKGHSFCLLSGDRIAEERTRPYSPRIITDLSKAVDFMKAGRCEMLIVGQFNWIDIDREKLGPLCESAQAFEAVNAYHYVNRRHADLVPKLTEAIRQATKTGGMLHFLQPVRDEIKAAKARSRCSIARN